MIRPYDERPKFETIPQALDLLRKAVETRGGDYRYTPPTGTIGCVYVHAGSCSCLIGVALHLLGWTVEEIEQLDTRGHLGTAVGTLAGKITADTPDGRLANSVLREAQSQQDNGRTWNDALAAALKEAYRHPDDFEFFGYVKGFYLVEAK